MAKSPAQRAYIRRLAALMSVYMIAIIGGMFAKRAGMLNQPATIAVALLSGVCVAGVFWAIARLIVEEKDEFQRMLIVRQAMVATGFSLSIAAIHGFLSAFDVIAKTDLYWAAVLWFFGLGIGAVVNRIQFGTWGQCA
ncbi:MAG: hypothetical protein ABI412_00940 [Sphingomicrobium sp.]